METVNPETLSIIGKRALEAATGTSWETVTRKGIAYLEKYPIASEGLRVLIPSDSEAGTHWIATPTTCECRGNTYQRKCFHRVIARLLMLARQHEQEQAYVRLPESWKPTDTALYDALLTDRFTPLPDAPVVPTKLVIRHGSLIDRGAMVQIVAYNDALYRVDTQNITHDGVSAMVAPVMLRAARAQCP